MNGVGFALFVAAVAAVVSVALLARGLMGGSARTTLPGFANDFDAMIEIRSLSPQLAQQLITQGHRTLLLFGLETLDASTAQVLAQFRSSASQTPELRLGLTSLDAATAKELAKFHGNLELNRVRTLSLDAAEALAQFRGLRLDLNGLDSWEGLAGRPPWQDGAALRALKSNPAIQSLKFKKPYG